MSTARNVREGGTGPTTVKVSILKGTIRLGQ